MKQRTNGRAVRGAARESNGARKGLRVGKAAGCMYTADSESERYEYDKARYIVFRIHRESAARVATRVEGPEGVAVFVFVPRPSSRYANRIPRGRGKPGAATVTCTSPGVPPAKLAPKRYPPGARLPSPIRQPTCVNNPRVGIWKMDTNATGTANTIADTRVCAN